MATVSTFGACECSMFSWIIIRVPDHVFLFRHRQHMNPLGLLLSVYEYPRYDMQNQSTRSHLPIPTPPVYESVGPSSFRVWISSVRYAKSEYQITFSYSGTASIWIRWPSSFRVWISSVRYAKFAFASFLNLHAEMPDTREEIFTPRPSSISSCEDYEDYMWSNSED